MVHTHPDEHGACQAPAVRSTITASEFSQRLVDNAARNGYSGVTSVVADAFLLALQNAATTAGMVNAPSTVALGNALYQRAAQSEDSTNPIP